MKKLQAVVAIALFVAASAYIINQSVHTPELTFAQRQKDLLTIAGQQNAAAAEVDKDWFMTQRSYPFNDIPQRAHMKMRTAMRQRYTGKKTERTQFSSSDWELVGPSNIGGRISCVLVHPTDASTIYAGAASGGVWKSTDMGGTWENVFNESFSIGALAFEPNNPSVIYVGTGENLPAGVATYPGNGVYRSTDAGATWTNLGLSEIAYTGKIVLNPGNPNEIFVAGIGLYRAKTTDRGVYRSSDRGNSWTKVLYLNDSTGAIDLVMDPLDTNRIFAAMWTRYRTPQFSILTGPTSGLYLSTNGGTSWTPVTNGFPNNDNSLGRISVTYAPSSPLTMYALTESGIGWGGVYKSLDGGNSWTQTYDGSSSGEGQVWYNNVITVHPTDPDFVWAGMTTMYQSTTGGTFFSPASIFGDYHVDHHAIVYAPSDPNIIIFGNDGGIFVSTNGGALWTKSYNLPITQFYAGWIAQQDPLYLLGGTQDNNSMRTFTSAPSSWNYMFCCDGFFCLVDPTDLNYVYAEYQNGGLGYSTDGGFTFFTGTTGINGSDRKNWRTPIAMDMQRPKTLYTGTHRMYVTHNNMQSWTAISGDLTYGNGGRVGTISAIDVSRTDSSVIYVGTDDGRVWVTTDGGTNWNDIAATLPLRWVTSVTVDPFSPNIAYVTLSGFIQNDYGGHVYRTTNYGTTWTNIGTTLPDIPVNDIVVDSVNTSHLFIATDLNVMYSANLGVTWDILGTALPEVSVHDLAMHWGARTLAAFTHGRSVFTFDVTNPPQSSLNVSVHNRWNLVSVPLLVNDYSKGAIFPTAVTDAYAYQGNYVSSPTLMNTPGYWLKFSGSQTVNIPGDVITTDTFEINTGWNLIGSISTPVPVSSISSDPGGIITTQFFGYNGSYVAEDTIEPGKGYWVKVSGDGELVLSSAGNLPVAGRIRVIPTEELPPAPPSLGGSETQHLKPETYHLGQNYPNPFNPSTMITYQMPEQAYVSLKVYNTAGQLVATLVDEMQEAGFKSVRFDAKSAGGGLPSGVYIYQITAGRFTESKKMLLIQ
jgi:photosystem II stability/assembly factor-like uncharacterized protein